MKRRDALLLTVSWLGVSAAEARFSRGVTSGGGSHPSPPVLPPGAMGINIANAPGWLASTSYSTGARVTAGPAWNGSAYTNGAALWLWALVGSGGTSGASFPISGTVYPSYIGGGFNGTPPAGWTGATNISDGTLTWVCISPVDYVTVTDCMLAGAGTITTYSSQANVWPIQTLPPHIQFNNPVYMQIWYGGSNRQLYQGGQHGELDPIPFQDHIDFVSDQEPQCQFGGGGSGSGCNGMVQGTFWFFYAAPGDSHNDNRSAGWRTNPATRVDSTKGVTFYSNSAGNENPGTGCALGFSDSYGTVTGIQFQAVNWFACASHGLFLPGNQHTNGITFDHCIVQSDSGPGTMAVDAGMNYKDSLLLYLGSTAGAMLVIAAYATIFNNTTLLDAGAGTGTLAFGIQAQLASYATVITNCDFSGFAYDFAFQTVAGSIITTGSANNTSDLPGGGSPASITISMPANYGNPYSAIALPGWVP